ELAAGVQHREYHLDRRLPLGLHDVHRDAAAVVGDPHRAVGEDGDIDRAGVTGQRLVHGVVHDLVDEVVQATLPGGADVHAGPLAHGLQALENRDVRRVVAGVLR